jgi:hypothetical protein
MKLGQGCTHPGMNGGSSRLNDDGDAVVEAVAEPVEWHGCARLSGLLVLGMGEIPCKRFLLLCCLSVLGQVQGLTAAMFYVTGSQFYEACRQRQAKEKIDGGFKDAEADNPSQAALWGSCGGVPLS